jgi:hypothetical protein
MPIIDTIRYNPNSILRYVKWRNLNVVDLGGLYNKHAASCPEPKSEPVTVNNPSEDVRGSRYEHSES